MAEPEYVDAPGLPLAQAHADDPDAVPKVPCYRMLVTDAIRYFGGTDRLARACGIGEITIKQYRAEHNLLPEYLSMRLYIWTQARIPVRIVPETALLHDENGVPLIATYFAEGESPVERIEGAYEEAKEKLQQREPEYYPAQFQFPSSYDYWRDRKGGHKWRRQRGPWRADHELHWELIARPIAERRKRIRHRIYRERKQTIERDRLA